jgi:muramoyltetrapeptide carboxypeptidase
MNRRKFLTASTLTFVSTGLSSCAQPFLFSSGKLLSGAHRKLKPKRLKEGDRVGIIAPASFITEEDFEKIRSNLESLNLIAIPSKNLFKKSGYLAGSDNERVEDLHEMFARKDIAGIFCARGGYGTPRLLQMIDYDLIKRNPKILIGYSDITALLIAIYVKTGLVTFHGAVGISTFNDFTKNYLTQVLFEAGDYVELISEPEFSDEAENITSSMGNGILKIFSGRAEGELIGGNLSLLVSLLGTDFDFDPTNKIIFLEEVGEEPYRIDRMLTQLINAGKLQKCKAIVMGVFSNCEVKKDNPSFSDSFNLREVIFDRLGSLGIPVIYGLSFGHIKNKFTLPIGVRAMIDVDNERFSLLESAVE